jgi:MFS family permease
MSFTSALPVRAGWRDVYLAVGARAVSLAGDFLAATTLVLYLQTNGYGGFAVAGVLLAAALPPVVLAPLAGRLVDRVDSRTLLVSVGLGQALCCFLMAYTGSPLLLIALAALLAAGVAVTNPTIAALLPDMVDRERLPRALAVSQSAVAIGGLLGPALAGLLVGGFGLRVPLLVDAVTYLALAGVGLALRTRRNAGAARSTATESSSRATTWRLRDDRLLFAIIVQLGIMVGVLNINQVVEVFFLRETLGASETVFGLVTAAWTGAMLVGGWLFAMRTPDDPGLARRIAWLGGVTALVVVCVGQAPNVLVVAGLMLVGGICNGGENGALSLLALHRVPAAARGRMFAQLGAVVNTANMAGYCLGGLLAERFAPGPVITGTGLVGLLAILVTSVAVWREGHRERIGADVPGEPDTEMHRWARPVRAVPEAALRTAASTAS